MSEENSKETNNLLKCPFCGGEAELKTEFTSYFSIGCRCKDCGAKTVRYCPDIKKEDALDRIEECKERAIEAWNTRKPMQNIVERLEEPTNYTIVKGKHFTTVERAIEIVKEEGGLHELSS